MIFLNAFQISLPAGLTTDQVVGIAVILGGYIGAIGLEKQPEPLPDPEPLPEPDLPTGDW